MPRASTPSAAAADAPRPWPKTSPRATGKLAAAADAAAAAASVAAVVAAAAEEEEEEEKEETAAEAAEVAASAATRPAASKACRASGTGARPPILMTATARTVTAIRCRSSCDARKGATRESSATIRGGAGGSGGSRSTRRGFAKRGVAAVVVVVASSSKPSSDQVSPGPCRLFSSVALREMRQLPPRLEWKGEEQGRGPLRWQKGEDGGEHRFDGAGS